MWLTPICLFAQEESPHSLLKHQISEIKYYGIKWSDRDWIKSYLSISVPMTVTEEDLRHYEKMLLTTNVIYEAEAKIEDLPGGRKALAISIKEKWSLIPVIRGQFGGGTPLYVLGAYDTHSFGRFWTIGGEFQKYGDSPTSFVVYGKIPRAMGGKYFFGSEVWQVNRSRNLYSPDDKKALELDTKLDRVRARFLMPLAESGGMVTWRYGLDFVFEGQSAEVLKREAGFESTNEALLEKIGSLEESKGLSVLPTLVYDDVTINNISFDGLRVLYKLGTFVSSEENYLQSRLNVFYYNLLHPNWNIASQLSWIHNESKSYQAQNFLGGFDSVRGTPDGGIFGSKAFFANFELRHIIGKLKYTWFQGAVFFDWGMAHNDYGQITDHQRRSAGLGIRFYIPQTTRVMFRFDFAFDLDNSDNKGLSAGMNQFFQPYRPL